MSIASPFTFLLSRIDYASGSMIGGTVTFYEAGTTTLLPVYTDNDATSQAANPYTLSANGGATLYGIGNYRVVVKNAGGVTKYDWDDIEVGPVSYPVNVDSIAALRLITGKFEGQSVQVKGYYAQAYPLSEPPSGGGPVRYWSKGQADGYYVDNGIDIIVPTGGDGSAAWVFNVEDHIDIRWAGAKGDGTIADPSTGTDDTDAFQRAIDSKHNIFVSPGIYNVEGTLELYDNSISALWMHGENSNPNATGARTNTFISFGGTSAFSTKVKSTWGTLTDCQVNIKGIAFQARNSNCVFLDRVKISFSNIESCTFSAFKHVLYGTFNGLSTFKSNLCSSCKNSAFKILASNAVNSGVSPAVEFDPSIVSPLVDSSITDNYFNGDSTVAAPNFYGLEIKGSGSSFVTGNYLDYFYGGINSGTSNGLVNISNNTFDILYIGINLSYGARDIAISNNRFLRIRNASKSYFTNPTAAMSANSWECVTLDQFCIGTTITDNTIKLCDRFITMSLKWYKNINESGNICTDGSLLTPLVYMLTRAEDEAGFITAGETSGGDGTGFKLDSLQEQTRTTIPHPRRESYEGHVFNYFNRMIVNRSKKFYDFTGGLDFYGLTNLAPSDDYSSGWVASGDVTIVGGVLTDGNSSNQFVYNTLGSDLAEGTYIVVMNVTTYTTGTLFPAIQDDLGTNINGVGNYYAVYGTGYFYAQITIPVGRLGKKLALYCASNGVSNMFKIYKVA